MASTVFKVTAKISVFFKCFCCVNIWKAIKNLTHNSSSKADGMMAMWGGTTLTRQASQAVKLTKQATSYHSAHTCTHTHHPHTATHIHIRIYMHKHSHTHTYFSLTYTHICTHSLTHTHTYMHTHSHTQTHLSLSLSLSHTHTQTRTHTPEKRKKMSQNSLIPDGSSPMLDSELLSECPGLLTMLLKRRVVTGLSQPCSRFWLRVRGRYWNVSRRKVVISSSTRQASILTA